MRQKTNGLPSRLKPLAGLANANLDSSGPPECTIVNGEEQVNMESTNTPPPYSERRLSSIPRNIVHDDVRTPITPIPSRSPIYRSMEHRYDITGSRSKPWATLKLISKKQSSAMAKVYGGHNISGSVEIDLDTVRTIHSIALTLHGEIMTTSLQNDSYTFLNYRTTIWTRRDGLPTPLSLSPLASLSHPEYRITPFIGSPSPKLTKSDISRLPSPTSSIAVTQSDLPSLARLIHPEYIITPFILPSPSIQGEFNKVSSPSSPSPVNSSPSNVGCSNGKILGGYEWPFSFPFPTEVDVSRKKLGRTAIWTSNPPSTQGHGANVTIKYYLTLNISHGNFRKVSRVDAPIIYMPTIVPDAVSSLCQAAYLALEAPPSPLVDGLGWKNLPQVSIRGQVFRHRALDVTCMLSLANPQCYTQGTTIPCFLTASSLDFEALNSLVPKTIYVRLMRWIKYFAKPEFQMHMGEDEMIERSREISRAVWQLPPTESDPQEKYTRRAQGEIPLNKQLLPSCSTRFFSVRYTVELLPFDSNDLFQNENDATEVLLAHEVGIATRLGKGSTPVALTASSLRPAQTTDVKVNDIKFAYKIELPANLETCIDLV